MHANFKKLTILLSYFQFIGFLKVFLQKFFKGFSDETFDLFQFKSSLFKFVGESSTTITWVSIITWIGIQLELEKRMKMVSNSGFQEQA